MPSEDMLKILKALKFEDRKLDMSGGHGHPLFYQMLGEAAKLHSDKNKDYARGGDPLGNFKRVSAVLKVWGYDIPPELVGMIYLLKQMDCAMWMSSQGYEGEVEGFDKRMADVGVYAPLIRILRKEGE